MRLDELLEPPLYRVWGYLKVKQKEHLRVAKCGTEGAVTTEGWQEAGGHLYYGSCWRFLISFDAMR